MVTILPPRGHLLRHLCSLCVAFTSIYNYLDWKKSSGPAFLQSSPMYSYAFFGFAENLVELVDPSMQLLFDLCPTYAGSSKHAEAPAGQSSR